MYNFKIIIELIFYYNFYNSIARVLFLDVVILNCG